MLLILNLRKTNTDHQLYETDKYFNYCKKVLYFFGFGYKKIFVILKD